MMEVQNCLEELFHDDNTEQDGVQSNYFDLIASKAQESLLCFDGIKILPPLLSDAEKNAMREYRRKAVELEQKLLEKKRQKYSNLVLKVMDIMDKFQMEENEETKIKTSSYATQNRNSSKNSELKETGNVQGQEEKKTLSVTNQDVDEKISESMKMLHENRGCTLHSEMKWKESNDQNVKDDLQDYSSIFRKPKLYNSSSSPRRNKVDSKRMSWQSDLTSLNNTNEPVNNLSLDRERLASRSDNDNRPKEMLDNAREIDAADSLASTVLSIAFTDSSVSSQLSTMEGAPQPTKPVQRRLNMESINHNTQSHYHNVKPLTSTPNDLQRPVTRSSQRAKKKTTSNYAVMSSKKNTETYSEQDRALEKLDLMRKKLLQEKEKQIALLRQQELARLRKNKDKQKYFQVSEELDKQPGDRDMYSQEDVTSCPASDMYSIPETSFEGSLTLRQDESASDKENNHYRYDPQQRVHHDLDSVVHYRGSDSPAKRNIEGGPFNPSPYVRKEFLKQIEVVIDQERDGKDKFSILTACAKGFLTRRILQAEKVQAIIKTIEDTNVFLADISKEGTSSYQDKSLQQRVHAQMVAAKTKLHDIFFKISVHERMAYIAHSRNVAKERQQRLYDKSKKSTRKLSSATLKAMQRRTSEQNENSELKRTSTQSPLGKRRNLDTRALKPVQSTKSPQLQGKGRSAGRRRPGTAPSPRHSIIKKNTYNSRPATAVATRQSNRKPISRRSVENDSTATHRPPRTSLEGKLQTAVKRVKTNNEQNANSKLPVRKNLGGGLTYRVSKDEDDKTQQQKASRPSRLSLEGNRQVLVKRDTLNTNKTTSCTRRTTRSMAAKFNKS